jgi:TatD DNase family protein
MTAGVMRIVTVGVDRNTSRVSVEISGLNPNIYAAVGCHPNEAAGFDADYSRDLERLASDPKVVAIGEIGLDFFRNGCSRDLQLSAFKIQLDLARRLNLPVIIHARQAENDVLSTLGEWTHAHITPIRKLRGVIHCFSGSVEAAMRYIDLGFFLSIGAYVGYPSSSVLRSVIKLLPLDCLMLESDCPFLPPQRLRGQRNEPCWVSNTAQELSRIKSITLDEVASTTSWNASQLFRLPV